MAMDVDHTLWYEDFGTGVIQHFATNGTYLGSEHYAGLGEALVVRSRTPSPHPNPPA